MMSMTVGTLRVLLELDDSQFNRGIDQAHGKIDRAGRQIEGKLGKVGGAFGTAFKRGAVVAGAAITGLVGTALVKGFQRLSSIENATAKLTGLGHSAAEVQLIMDNALASVKGTVSLGEMGAVFNKVAASNKIQGDVIAQLNDMGIPIVQLLGKTLGKTSAEVVALASAGK